MTRLLDGKSFLVTGAARGLGALFCQEIAGRKLLCWEITGKRR